MANNFKCCHILACGSKHLFDPLCEFINNECRYGCEECENYDHPATCDFCDYKDYRDGFKSDTDYLVYWEITNLNTKSNRYFTNSILEI